MSELMTEEPAPELTETSLEQQLEACAGYMMGFGAGFDEDPAGDTPEALTQTDRESHDDETTDAEGEELLDESEDEAESPEEDVPERQLEEGWPYGKNETSVDQPPSRDISTRELGRRGENAATNYLIRKGYRILERNWTCKFGEADIIAIDPEGTVVFVEVKTRRTDEAGLPEEAITVEKQRRYEKLALTYMIEAEWNEDVNLRFDAIGINVTGDFKAILKHHMGCFDGSY